MVTYAYWFATILIVIGILGVVGFKLGKWPLAATLAALVLIASGGYYYFYLQQILVKRWGGVMSISVPDGQQHIGSTWKDDNLWIENYDPANNTCIFSEYSRGNLLEGKVVIKNCNPLGK